MEAPVSSQPAPEPQPAAAGPPDRLWNRSFFLFWLGQTISQLGNPAFSIGAMLWMKDATGSASLMGLLMTASSLPALLLSPFGGTFADRHSRVGIMVWSDVAAGIAVLVFTTAIWLRPADTGLVIPLLFGVAVALGIIRAVFHPAVGALVPDLVSKEKLPAANSLTQLSVQASIFAGQAVGGILYKAFGPALLFCIDGVSYLIAAVCTLFIPRDRPRQRAAPVEAHSFRHFLTETADGFRYVWAQKGLRDVLLTAALLNFLAAPGLVLFPFYVDLYLGAEASWYGYLMAGLSVGVVVGFVGAGALRLTGRARVQGVLGSFILYPFFFGSLVFWRSPLPALVAVFLGGLTTGFVNVYLIALAQGSTPAELRGRVMAFLGLLTGGLMPLGMALGGFAGDLTNKNVPLVFGVCAVLAMLNVLLLASRRHAREYLAS
jgi:MFS transporter, DHA3 family, macrolide efflux protein